MRLKQSLGFTLIELVMVLMIMSVISIVVGKSLFQSFQTFITAQNALEVDWNGFLALQRINNDVHTIRSAGSITTISAANFVFTDIDGTSVQYQLTGNNLMRNSQILADGIQSLSFTYSDKSGTVTATPSLVRYITITVTPTEGDLSLPFTTVAATRVYP